MQSAMTLPDAQRTQNASGQLSAMSQAIEWMGIAFNVPEDWQIVRHGLSLDRGSLTLVDRRVQRLQLMWTNVKQEPDVERMIEHARKEAEKSESAPDVRAFRGFGSWRVLRTALPSGLVTTRAARFDAKTSRLLEAIVSTTVDEPRGDELVGRLLEAMRVVCRAEAAQRWCAFDVSVALPPDFRLSSTTVNPADVTLHFEAVDPEDGHELGAGVTIRRMGMVADWYAGNAEALIRRDARKVEFESFAAFELHGHPATEAVGREPAPPLRRVLGRERECRVLLWHCEPENALYRVTTSCPPTRRIRARDFDVDCCTRKRHG
jgi:hypothetical protein